jgi:ribonuclease HI
MEIINIYTDGSLMKKGKNIHCGYGIYFPNEEYKQISRKFTHEPITNNRAELYAILKSIIIANIINKKNNNCIKKINIYSDSEYAVKSINIWLAKWKKSGKLYLNPDIIDEIDKQIIKSPFIISIIHIRAHTGNNDIHSINNNIADDLAKKGALK